MRRLGLSPSDIEVGVLSHGHSDHVSGLDGLVRPSTRDLPLIVHPGVWTTRRIAVPGLFELELQAQVCARTASTPRTAARATGTRTCHPLSGNRRRPSDSALFGLREEAAVSRRRARGHRLDALTPGTTRSVGRRRSQRGRSASRRSTRSPPAQPRDFQSARTQHRRRWVPARQGGGSRPSGTVAPSPSERPLPSTSPARQPLHRPEVLQTDRASGPGTNVRAVGRAKTGCSFAGQRGRPRGSSAAGIHPRSAARR
jgi:hypothetical protein